MKEHFSAIHHDDFPVTHHGDFFAVCQLAYFITADCGSSFIYCAPEMLVVQNIHEFLCGFYIYVVSNQNGFFIEWGPLSFSGGHSQKARPDSSRRLPVLSSHHRTIG